MDSQIPIFVINLAKDTHKKQHMKQMLDSLKLDYEFFDAVYGKELSEDYIHSVYDDLKAISVYGRSLTKGEIGCALSHFSIYKKMVENDVQQAIILEDDIDINNKFKNFIDNTQKLPKDGDLFLLTYHRGGPNHKRFAYYLQGQKRISNELKAKRFYTSPLHSTCGYLITLNGAKKLLEVTKDGFSLPIDLYTGDAKYTNMYGIVPQVVRVNEDFISDSLIESERIEIGVVKPSIQEEKKKIRLILKKLGLFTIAKRINYKFQIEKEHYLYVIKHIKECLKTPLSYK